MLNHLSLLLDIDLVVCRADYPALRSACDHALRRHEIVSLLPGIYARTSTARDARVRALAVCHSDPDAVVMGECVPFLLGWSKTEPAAIEAATRRLRDRSWVRVSERHVPPELRYYLPGLTVTNPALTALDLAERTSGASIDDALRRGVPLRHLHAALVLRPAAPGTQIIRRLLSESRDEPWSPAERRAHVLLRRAGVTGWKANHRVVRDDGSTLAFLDLAFPGLQLAFEIDGGEWHLGPAAVLRDRHRDQELAKLGWVVVRFGAFEVFNEPERFLAAVQAIVSARRATFRSRRG